MNKDSTMPITVALLRKTSIKNEPTWVKRQEQSVEILDDKGPKEQDRLVEDNANNPLHKGLAGTGDFRSHRFLLSTD